MMIRHRVVDVLLRQADDQFEADYSHFHHPGESKERAVGAPVLLKGSSRRLGIVLVHGFLASPREMHELAAYLHGNGFWVYSVRLRGHGTSPEDLATRSGSDWIESVDIGFALMSAICTQVVIGGFSFGGGLALDCAARLGGLAGVFAVSPPFRLQDISSRFASAVTTWNRLMDSVHCQGAAKEYVERISERPLINYARIPIAALSELGCFMKGLEVRLAEVQAPTLVVQGHGDPVVNSEGTALLFNRVGSKNKQYVPFNSSRHGILAGEDSEHVHAVIAEFIAKL
jgi:esterase/lipase